MATTATASATTTTKDDDDDDYPTNCDLDFASSFSPFEMPQRYNDDGFWGFSFLITYFFAVALVFFAFSLFMQA